MKKILTFIIPIVVLTAFVSGVSALEYQKTLRPGSSGEQVSELQQVLKEQGYYYGAIDGKYGPATSSAVLSFQRLKKLSADGIAGAKTFSNLQTANEGNVLGATTYKRDCSKESISQFGFSRPCNSALKKNPVVTSVSHQDVTEDSVVLHGEFNSFTHATDAVFFVYGQDENQIEDIADDYNRYTEVQEDGDDLQKRYSGSNQVGDFGITTNDIQGIDEGEDYFYTACIEFTNSQNNQQLVCGNIGEFEAGEESGSFGDCLEINRLSSPDFQTVNSQNRQVAEFEIQNGCTADLDLSYLGFNVISTFSTHQFSDITIEIEGEEEYEVEEIETVYSSPFNGNHLSFSTNITVGEVEIPGQDEIEIEIFADIDGVHPNWVGGDLNTAFAVGLQGIHYRNSGNPYVYGGPEVYDNVIVIDYNNS